MEGSACDDGRKEKGSVTRIVASYAVCASIWGTTWYAVRVCVSPGAYPAYQAAALRFAIASAALLVCLVVAGKHVCRPNFKQVAWVALAGLFSGLSYGFLYVCEEQVSGGIAAVISALGPMIAALMAMVTGTEKPTRLTLCGSLLAMLGVAVIFHDRLQISPGQASAVGLLLVCVCLSSASGVTLKRHGHGMHALLSNTIFVLTTALVLCASAAIKAELALPAQVMPAAFMALIYLAVFGTVVTFWSYFYLLKHVRLSTVMTLSFVTPVIALLVDACFEKHMMFTGETYLGLSTVLAGVAATVLPALRARTAAR